MALSPEATKPAEGTQYDWKKHEGEHAASALSKVLNGETGRQRKAYTIERERHERLAAALAGDPAARGVIEALGAVKFSDAVRAKPSRFGAADRALDYQMDVMSGNAADRFSFRSAPFDVRWTSFEPEGAKGTGAHGPSADLAGHMSLDLTETYVDRPVAEGGWMRNAAGVGAWFKPKSPSTYVRVAPYTPYEYRWKDDSSLQVAHNRGDIGVFVQRHLGPGQFETVLDSREALWRDGTSWYQTHQDEQSGQFVASNYFFASSNDWYLVWVWCNSGIDFATKTTFGSSKAFNNMKAGLKWLVFEQWA
jgi:hypothetical protein